MDNEMTDDYTHMVFAITSDDGKRVRLAPELELKISVTKFFGFKLFEDKYMVVKSGQDLNRTKAVEIAKKYLGNEKYQDVYVVRYNSCDEMGNELAKTKIWENGRFQNEIIDMDMFRDIKYEGIY